jgi:alpha-galactosidase
VDNPNVLAGRLRSESMISPAKMRRTHKFSLVLMAGMALTNLVAEAAFDPAASRDKDSLARFVAAHVARAEAPPFSFLFDGRPSAALLPKWTSTSETRATGDKTLVTTVYIDPATKLRVTVVYTLFADYPAVEWVVRFRNEGRSDTPIIQNILVSALRFEDWPEGPSTLFRARGSDAERTDFAPIADALASGSEVVFGPKGGRSSDTALPFFNIAGSGRGVMAAVGWTGRWKAVVRQAGAREIGLDAGMEQTRFRLHPGEEVRTPSLALLFWRGADRFEGHNLFRRFILAHHAPRPNGRLVEPPLSHGVGFGGPAPCNEYTCATESYVLSMIDRLSQFGLDPDAYWIDAGWYENAGPSWWEGVGAWTPDRKRFPRGLKTIGDAVRSKGKRFVLWFEPERVYEGTRIDREHPEWLIRLPNNPDRVFNLGNAEARDWMIDHVSNLLLTEGVSIYRQDFNINAAPYWRTLDAPDRVGIAEIRHIEGLYAYWDALLAKVPGLLIDNCAGGGRRIDIESLSRSIPLWRTDSQPFEPNGEQGHTYGLQLYVPQSGTGNKDPRKYAFRSAMSGATVLAWDINGSVNGPTFDLNQAREDIAEFRALRPFFTGDYYPLTEYSTEDEAWAAFQWNRPEQQDGIVLAFRRPKSVESVKSLVLHGLDPGADYEVGYEDYGIVVVKNGKELLGGLDVKIPEPTGSLLIKYRRVR